MTTSHREKTSARGGHRLAKKFALLLTFTFVFGAVALVVSVKSVRILVPQVFGLKCVSETLCIDEVGRLDEVIALLADAKSFVNEELGGIQTDPTVLFCSTDECFDRFSEPTVSAQYFWGARTILLGGDWEPFILRHELIHHWQNDNFGGPSEALRLPMWFLEGMAYTLSGDPRDVIPNPQAQAQREQFVRWQSGGNNWRMPPPAISNH